jgi:hypothetical protein
LSAVFKTPHRVGLFLCKAKKTGATSDVAPAEETAQKSVVSYATRTSTASGRRDSKLTPTKLTNATARL